MEMAVIAALLLGVAIGVFWKETTYRELKGKYDSLTDRDARGRFVRRD